MRCVRAKVTRKHTREFPFYWKLFVKVEKVCAAVQNFQLLYVHPFWLLKKEPLAHLSFGDQKMANLMNIVLRCESKVHSNILLRFNISTSRAPNSYGSGNRSRHLNVKNFSTGNCIPCSGLFTADSKSLSKSQF